MLRVNDKDTSDIKNMSSTHASSLTLVTSAMGDRISSRPFQRGPSTDGRRFDKRRTRTDSGPQDIMVMLAHEEMWNEHNFQDRAEHGILNRLLTQDVDSGQREYRSNKDAHIVSNWPRLRKTTALSSSRSLRGTDLKPGRAFSSSAVAGAEEFPD